MMLLLIAAFQIAPATAQVSHGPRVIASNGILRPDDYPRESLQQDESGVVSVLVQVSAEGKPMDCTVTESSGFERLDLVTCRLVKLRARFEPAVDGQGKAIPGEYRSAYIWGFAPREPRARFTVPLEVSTIPADYRAPPLRLIFGPTGRVADCEVQTGSGSSAADRAACTYFLREVTLPVPPSASKNPGFAAVRYATVPLSTEKPPQTPAE